MAKRRKINKVDNQKSVETLGLSNESLPNINCDGNNCDSNEGECSKDDCSKIEFKKTEVTEVIEVITKAPTENVKQKANINYIRPFIKRG